MQELSPFVNNVSQKGIIQVAIALNSWLTTGWDPILVKQGKLQMRTLVSDGSLDRAIRIFSNTLFLGVNYSR
jgi:hypothetical protein